MATKLTEASTPRIAFCGKIRSGKSTCASHLFMYYGFTQVSFGTRLKAVADDLFQYSEVYPKVDGKKPRKLYQDFGQLVRTLDSNVWIDQAASMVEFHEDSRRHRGIVIDDLRQPDEYAWAKANGFTIIRVSADDEVRKRRAELVGDDFTEEDLRHDTEMHTDDFAVDYEITNDGRDYGELGRKVDEIMAELGITKGGAVV